MDMDVQIDGLENLSRKFFDLSKQGQTAVFRKAMRQGGNIVLRDARQRVPVDTGNLKKSLQLRVRLYKDGFAYARVRARRPAGSHAHLVELGTVRMAAQPYLRPALDTNRDPILRQFITAMNEEIVKRSESI